MTTRLILLTLLWTLAVGPAQAEDERPIPDIKIAHEFVDCWTAIQYLKLTVGASAGEDSSVAKSYMARNADRFEKALIGAIQFYWKHLTDSGADRDDLRKIDSDSWRGLTTMPITGPCPKSRQAWQRR